MRTRASAFSKFAPLLPFFFLSVRPTSPLPLREPRGATFFVPSFSFF
jgi:hypothetical protein